MKAHKYHLTIQMQVQKAMSDQRTFKAACIVYRSVNTGLRALLNKYSLPIEILTAVNWSAEDGTLQWDWDRESLLYKEIMT